MHSPVFARAKLLPKPDEVRDLLRLALPVVVVQVGMMLMGVVDTIMIGHYSTPALAAVALGNLYFFTAAVFGMGVLMALDPVVAQAVGAGDGPAVGRGVQRGLLLSLLLTVMISLALAPAGLVLRKLGQPDDVVPLAALYARITIPGVYPFLAFVVLRQTLQAMKLMQPIVITIIGANIANVALNWTLIFGHWGFPELGIAGASWATSISRWIMMFALLALGWRTFRGTLVPFRPETLALAPLLRMIRLGVPIGLQMQLEFGAFALIGLLMGWIGTTAMAGHQVAINIASLTFMVPLGLGAAAAVLVGQAVGRGDAAGARQASRAALVCAVAFMTASAVVMLLVPDGLARIYSSEPEVLAAAVLLIPIAGVFQVFDGIQVVAVGILRGIGDTRAPVIINLLGFWMLGVPLSAWLGFRTPLGAAGLWWGLVAGLVAVAVFLLLRVRVRLSRALHRILIDDHAPVDLVAGRDASVLG